MTLPPLPTRFAPAERVSIELVERQAAWVAAIPMLPPVLDAVPDPVMILNSQRQIVFFNRALLELIQKVDGQSGLGLRPGEVLGCTHADEEMGGCGTSEYCLACGATQAILSGLSGQAAYQECRMRLKEGDALDMGVYASPLTISKQACTILVMKDISHEKRRLALEHLFFHDVLNSTGALRGLAEVLQRAPLEDKDDIARDIWSVCDRLIDEIKSQKQLAAAESQELEVERSLIHTHQFLNDTLGFYHNLELARRKKLVIDPDSCDIQLISDRVLLRRVLGNMIKNALEASRVGDTVRAGCRQQEQSVEFWVNNPGVIPDEVRLQIFQRSFSTKGAGRGLGTYSIKLFGEAYLKGKVSFTSTPEDGTTFLIVLPLE